MLPQTTQSQAELVAAKLLQITTAASVEWG